MQLHHEHPKDGKEPIVAPHPHGPGPKYALNEHAPHAPHAPHAHAGEADSQGVVVHHEHAKPEPEEHDNQPYFKTETPDNLLNGIGGTEYNVVKGAIAGPALVFLAPVTGAVDGVHNGKDALESTGGFFVGFGRGCLRGIVGGSALVATGAITGTNQAYRGIVQAADQPGQGHGLKENIEHILNEPFLHLAGNVEPAHFAEDVKENFPVKEGEESPKYQFFMTGEPGSFYHGFTQAQYNAVKGLVASGTLVMCAPVKDTIDGYHANGIEGSVRGLGSGTTRGIVGGVTLLTVGAATSVAQLTRGFASLNNIPAAVEGAEAIRTDFKKLLRTPIVDLVLHNGPAPAKDAHAAAPIAAQ